MRPSFVRHTMPGLILVGAPWPGPPLELLGCSGPGAARTIRESDAHRMVVCGHLDRQRRRRLPSSLPIPGPPDSLGGCPAGASSQVMDGRSPRRLRLWTPMVVLDRHPGNHCRGRAGDLLAAARRNGTEEMEMGTQRCACRGLAGLVIAALILEGPGSMSAANAPLGYIRRVQHGSRGGPARRRPLSPPGPEAAVVQVPPPNVFAAASCAGPPLCPALLPVCPYQASVSTTSPFRFVVVDDATGRPIPSAAVRLIDPRFAPDDTANQGERVVTGADGSVDYFLSANIQGREGLLWRTETISYNPWMIRVEAVGYPPFFTSLASAPPMPADRLTAPPLGLMFPPPPSVTIRLSREPYVTRPSTTFRPRSGPQ